MMRFIVKTLFVLFVFSIRLYSQQSPYEITLPYSCGFEDSIENMNWTLNAGSEGRKCTDKWMIGNLDYLEGDSSLYISCNNGNKMTYGHNPNYVMAYRPIFISKPDSIETPRCKVNVSFAWKGGSEGRDVSTLKYYMVPEWAVIEDGRNDLNSNSLKATLPGTFKNTHGKLHGKKDWTYYSWDEGITYDETYYLIFIWQNNNTDTSLIELSMCIDDIQITTGTCPKPDYLQVDIVEDSMIISWDGAHKVYDLEYRVPGMRTWRKCHGLVYEDFTQKKEIVLKDLVEGVYDVRVRGGCGENGVSAWLTKSEITVFSPEKHCINYIKLSNNPDVTCLQGRASDPTNPLSAVMYPLLETGIGVENGFFANAIDYGPKDMRSRHTVNWKQDEFDPRTGGGLRTIPEGSIASVRLGNWDINTEAEAIRYKYLVDTLSAKIILMKYAVVLEAPGHGPAEDPYFRLRLKDEDGRLISSTCGNFEFTPENRSIQWEAFEAYVWKDWTTIGMNIASLHGKVIEIELVTQDCLRSGHAGYAYFTLDCADAVIRTSSCGDADSISMEAPDGFRYQWSKKENRNLIVSTDRVLTVPANDTATYFCLVDYIGIDGCSFELSTLVRPRIPFADFEMKWEPQRCQNRMVFTNKSRVLTKVDGKITETDEPCETFYWSVDGMKYESQDENVVVTFPNEGGNFTMHLMTGISNDACLDDTTFTIVVPSISSTVDSLYKEKCEADVEFFADQYIMQDGVYEDNDTTWCGCDSLTVLDLKFLPTPEATLVYDTICSEQGFVFNGKVYNESGVYEDWLKTKKLGCDSLVILNLTKMAPMAATVKSEYRTVCADDEFLYVDYEVVSGKREPYRYSVLFDAFAKQYGFKDADFEVDLESQQFVIEIPDSCRPNTYTASIVLRDSISFCEEFIIPIQFNVYYSSSILQPKFGNLITVYDADSNGGYSFVPNEYKWYRNDTLLVDERKAHLYLGDYKSFKAGDCYYIEVKRIDDGVVMRTCEVCPDVETSIEDIYDSEWLLQTTVLDMGSPIMLEGVDSGIVNIYSFTGMLISSRAIDSDNIQIIAPNKVGFYIVQIKTENRNYVYKIWVK